jgi:DNA repair exonuclease SbcCD ATPase subunit
MEIISILLPIVLFIITLIVIFTIRSADRRERRLDVMRKYVNQYMGEIKEAEERFHEVLGVIETRLQNDKGEISQLFEQIHGEREQLLVHHEDLGELQSTFIYYREVLQELATLTTKAEQRIASIKEGLVEIKANEELVEQLEVQRGEIDNLLKDISTSVEKSVEEHNRRLEQGVGEALIRARIKAEEQIEAPLNQAHATFQAIISNVQAYMRELLERSKLLQETTQELSHASVATLDQLSQQVNTTKLSIEEGDQNIAQIDAERSRLQLLVEALHTELNQLEENIVTSSSKLSSKEEELKELEGQVESVKDELDLALAERERLKEEEEQRELLRKAQIDEIGDTPPPPEEEFFEEEEDEDEDDATIDLPFDEDDDFQLEEELFDEDDELYEDEEGLAELEEYWLDEESQLLDDDDELYEDEEELAEFEEEDEESQLEEELFEEDDETFEEEEELAELEESQLLDDELCEDEVLQLEEELLEEYDEELVEPEEDYLDEEDEIIKADEEYSLEEDEEEIVLDLD